VSVFEDALRAVGAGRAPAEIARELHAALSDEERLWLLDGDEDFWQGLNRFRSEGYNRSPLVHGSIERLGIPGIRFVDGPRGCVAGHGTAFPVSVARGATWDVDLEEQVGDVVGREIRAQGGNFFGGVCVNLPRHPAWGRAQETYGDDPYHLGEFGAALTRGAQRWVMACVKHYALNSMENARFTVDVTVDDATLHDVYLPHFRRVIDEDVAAVMAAYNSVNGEWCGQNRYLLTTVLRDLWKWGGITVTDFVWGMRDGAEALNAGMDLEEPFRQQRAVHLREQLATGRTTWQKVVDAGVRLMAAQLRSYAHRIPEDPPTDIMANDEARALARSVAARSMVLLKNERVNGTPVLPLDPASVGTIAVIGRLATSPNMGDHGSSDVRPPSYVTPLEGVRQRFPAAHIEHVGSDDAAEAASAAATADVALVVVGYDAHDEGEYIGLDAMTTPELLSLFPPLPDDMGSALREGFGPAAGQTTSQGGDRSSLTLRPVDEDIIRAVGLANPSTVVAIVASGVVVTESWRHLVRAVLMMWYAGMEGGRALADVLTGDHNPTGRLPFAIPTSEAHLPAFERDATAVTYDRFHGQRLLDHLGVPAAFPHGFGLSYTTFDIPAAVVESVGDRGATLTVHVRNSGDRDGGHVVQAYGRTRSGPYAGESMLVGFAPVFVPAGVTESVEVPIAFSPLAAWDARSGRRVLPGRGEIEIEVGSHAHDRVGLTLSLGSPSQRPS
jgi:beta-glucosidase